MLHMLGHISPIQPPQLKSLLDASLLSAFPLYTHDSNPHHNLGASVFIPSAQRRLRLGEEKLGQVRLACKWELGF